MPQARLELAEGLERGTLLVSVQGSAVVVEVRDGGHDPLVVGTDALVLAFEHAPAELGLSQGPLEWVDRGRPVPPFLSAASLSAGIETPLTLDEARKRLGDVYLPDLDPAACAAAEGCWSRPGAGEWVTCEVQCRPHAFEVQTATVGGDWATAREACPSGRVPLSSGNSAGGVDVCVGTPSVICAPGEIQGWDDAECQPHGPTCPSGRFAEAPEGGETWYVDPEAPIGGDGSASRPYRRPAEAVAASSAGDALLLSVGTHPGFTLPHALTVRGACVAETRVEGTIALEAGGLVERVTVAPDDPSPAITGTSGQVTLRDLRTVGGLASMRALGPTELVLERVAASTAETGISGPWSRVRATDLVIDRTTSRAVSLGAVTERFFAERFRWWSRVGRGLNTVDVDVELRSGTLEDYPGAAVSVYSGTLSARDLSVRDVSPRADASIYAGLGATIDVTELEFAGSGGIRASDATSVTLDTVRISSPPETAVSIAGGRARLDRVLVTEGHGHGFYFYETTVNPSTNLHTLDGLGDAETNPSGFTFIRSDAEITGLRVEGGAGKGITVESSENLILRGVSIRDRPKTAAGYGGYGIYRDGDGHLELDGALVEGTGREPIMLREGIATANLRRVRARRAEARAGLYFYAAGEVTLEDVRVEDVAGRGIYAFATDLGLDRVKLEGRPEAPLEAGLYFAGSGMSITASVLSADALDISDATSCFYLGRYTDVVVKRAHFRACPTAFDIDPPADYYAIDGIGSEVKMSTEVQVAFQRPQ